MKANVDFVGVETKDVKPHIDKNRKRLMDINRHFSCFPKIFGSVLVVFFYNNFIKS